jgi:hypothetical protein
MQLLDFAEQLVSAAREFVAPRYRPELTICVDPDLLMRAARSSSNPGAFCRSSDAEATKGKVQMHAIPERAERIARRAQLRSRIKVAFQFRHIWPDHSQTRTDIHNLIEAYRSLPL